MATREIHIDWTGPHTHAEVQAMNGKQDFGIYQFYGYHAVYGADTLLYIGKSQEGTFASRMTNFKDHAVRLDDYSSSGDVSLCIGRLHGMRTPDPATWSKEISMAEKLLIFAHSPAWNSQELNIEFYARDELFNVHVFNWGKHKRLLPEVSGRRYARNYPKDEHYHTYSL